MHVFVPVSRHNDGTLQDDASDLAADLDAEYDLRDGQVDMSELESELDALMSDDVSPDGDGEEMLADPSLETAPLLSHYAQPVSSKSGGPAAGNITMNGDARERGSQHTSSDSLLLSMQ